MNPSSSILDAFPLNSDPSHTVKSNPIQASDSDAQPETVYIILEHTYEHDQDRKGRTKVPTKFAYSSIHEANQAAYKILISRGGVDQDGTMKDPNCHTECFSGDEDGLSQTTPKQPKTKGKKRASTGVTSGKELGQQDGKGQKKQKKTSDVVDLTGV
ncbi:hypothetical protein I203_107635 [Kwoniella mangroviensis CBS 8507]|uniref:hypothetical protein n=1 Tax=Kwoniella mangroviensis CBS 8507 TaxID=1296122 RepID=UPI00080D61B6|nr:uncharacterized protein I203_02383 [Kwoniella mangroviensis CBS 8507]OCF68988.1 hypothetical protein I203_02383 [Kwoniella mangroviensis CBS 8507]